MHCAASDSLNPGGLNEFCSEAVIRLFASGLPQIRSFTLYPNEKRCILCGLAKLLPLLIFSSAPLSESTMSARLCCSLLLGALLLAGCAVPPANKADAPSAEAPAAAQRAPQSLRREPSQYELRITEVSNRMRAACVAEAFQPYFRKSACLPNGITEAMLSDRTRITREQRRAAEGVFELTHELNEETRRIMIETGTPQEARIAEEFRTLSDPRIEAMQEGLLKGTLTWGEYNMRRLELFEEIQRRRALLGAE